MSDDLVCRDARACDSSMQQLQRITQKPAWVACAEAPTPPYSVALCLSCAATDDRKLSPEALARALETLEGRAAPRDVVQIVNAAEVPYIVYDPVRKMFHRSNAPRQLFGDAKV